ncbi:autoinducer binding domain-containing protein [Burkholderia plantarii]|nr:autoinducer binding domain-containing protein [Burkholderia plantarii]ALK29604.1 transcriptional regulator, LuxR family [Burkholderia plantarii]
MKMDSWREDVMLQLERATDAAHAFSIIAKIVANLGFEYCAFGMRIPIPLSRMPVYMHNNYPMQWQLNYREQSLLRLDPTVDRGMRSTLPFLWPALSAHGGAFWEQAWSYGLRHGWVQSARDPSGAMGMFSFARSHTAIDRLELDAKESRLEWLSQISHATMARLLLPHTLPEVHHQLNAREREVLLWSAEGKTSVEIATILNLAESTVNYHVANAVKKLRASNKMHAVAKAAILGLLFSDVAVVNPLVERDAPSREPAPGHARAACLVTEDDRS